MRKTFSARSAALAAALALGGGAAAAQDAPGGSFGLELNNAADVNGVCRLTYVATNDTGTALDKTAYEVAVFDSEGTVSRLLILDFGKLPEGKTKVVQFDLSEMSCGGISRLLINSVSECATADGPYPFCMDALVTSSRTEIDFGL